MRELAQEAIPLLDFTKNTRKDASLSAAVAKATVPLAGTSVQPNSRIMKQCRHHHTDTD